MNWHHDCQIGSGRRHTGSHRHTPGFGHPDGRRTAKDPIMNLDNETRADLRLPAEHVRPVPATRILAVAVIFVMGNLH